MKINRDDEEVKEQFQQNIQNNSEYQPEEVREIINKYKTYEDLLKKIEPENQ